MKKADIFKKGWKFTVETSLIKATKNYWFYDVKCAYLKYGSNFPEIISYENLQDEFKVSKEGFIKVKRTSYKEDKDWKQIYNHFHNRFKEQKIKFIRF